MPVELDPGAVAVEGLCAFYRHRPGTDVVDPSASVDALVSVLADALAAGLTGTRAAVDCTAVAGPRPSGPRSRASSSWWTTR